MRYLILSVPLSLLVSKENPGPHYFYLKNIDSFNAIVNKVHEANFLVWTGLRNSVPKSLVETVLNLQTPFL